MMRGRAGRGLWAVALLLASSSVVAAQDPDTAWSEWGWTFPPDLENIRSEFVHPPVDCLPHTRWWWMGNALRKEDIRWQLHQMRTHGIGGVEQITMEQVYERGNSAYLSDAHLELLRFAVEQARDLGMEFSLNFGGPGWVIGGEWVPQEDRSKNLVPTWVDVKGPKTLEIPLPLKLQPLTPGFGASASEVGPADQLLAVVAVRTSGAGYDPESAQVLTPLVTHRTLRWKVPAGQWRIVACWLMFTGQGGAVDHFNQPAMERYCEYLGGRFRDAFGEHFGKTVDSFFCDSFEVGLLPGGLYWSGGLLEDFRAAKGYDLVPYLPALWWDFGAVTPGVRYDVNEFLHEKGLQTFFTPFLDWCARNGVKGRIQPYGFPTDVLEGAGRCDLPEMEITAGEKDSVPWFDTRIGPREYVSSGAHLYGRNIVTTEAYTYMHWEPYRATLQELKSAGDVFLRSGANKFYNHGYIASPERDIAPTRGFFAAIHISHDNVWWRYYPRLANYIARVSYLMRLGHPVARVAVYSPLANQWTENVLNQRKWTRSFDWGNLGELLLANGYDFDLINDDILQHDAAFEDGQIRVREQRFRVLVLPNVRAIPRASLERIAQYVESGGRVVALERLPEASTGLRGAQVNDEAVRALSGRLFAPPAGHDGVGRMSVGAGATAFLKGVMYRRDPLDLRSVDFDPFLKVLAESVPPDFALDLRAGNHRTNDQVQYVHRVLDEHDLYFVTNLGPDPVLLPARFDVQDKAPWRWEPLTGAVTPIPEFEQIEDVVTCPLRLAPFASQVFVFSPATQPWHVTAHDGDEITLDVRGPSLFTRSSGPLRAVESRAGDVESRMLEVRDIPAPLVVSGPWDVYFPGLDPAGESFPALRSWTEVPRLRHFSGTASYHTTLDLSRAYCQKDIELRLDLGQVGQVAEVWVNGKHAGVRWMEGQALDITPFVQQGENALTVDVTNTLINRVAGLTEMPPVPEALQEHFGGDLANNRSPAHNLIGFEPLPPSGLLGPVVITAGKRVNLSGQS